MAEGTESTKLPAAGVGKTNIREGESKTFVYAKQEAADCRIDVCVC